MSEHFGATTGRRRRRLGRRPPLPPSVAVLGGTGFLGAEIARRWLDAGARVTVLARHAPEPSAAHLLEGARLVLGDARDRATVAEALDGAAHVVDVLGAPHPAASAADPAAQHHAELPALDLVLAELHRRPGTGLTYVSSGGAVYGDPDVLPVQEIAPCRPRSPYGATKLLAERRALLAADDDGFFLRIVRVGNAYGPRQRHDTGQGVVAAMLHAARTGAPVKVFGDGTAVRDFVDARDVAGAVVGLASLGRGPRVVNVGAGVGQRILDVQATVEAVTQTRLEVWCAPRRPTDVGAVVLDLTRLRTLLDWRPRPFADGVADAWRAASAARPAADAVAALPR